MKVGNENPERNCGLKAYGPGKKKKKEREKRKKKERKRLVSYCCGQLRFTGEDSRLWRDQRLAQLHPASPGDSSQPCPDQPQTPGRSVPSLHLISSFHVQGGED